MGPTFVAVLAITAACWLPHMSWWPGLILSGVLVLALVVALFGLFLYRRRPKGIRIDAEGVTIGKTVRWDDIAEIRWTGFRRKKGRRFGVPSYLPLASRKELVQAALAHRPDLPVIGYLKRMLEHSGRRVVGMAIASTCFAIVGLLLAAIPVFTRFGDLSQLGLFGPAFLICLLLLSGGLWCQSTRAENWAVTTILLPLFLSVTSVFLLFLNLPLRAIDAVVIPLAVQSLIAAWVCWKLPIMTWRRESLIAAIMVVCAAAAYFGLNDSIEPTDLSRQFHLNDTSAELLPLVWLPDGSRAVNSSYWHESANRYLLDFSSKKAQQLPTHDSFWEIAAVNSRSVVRNIGFREHQTISLYDIPTGHETELGTAKKIFARPSLSPKSGRVGWMEIAWDQYAVLAEMRSKAASAPASQSQSTSVPSTLPARHGPPVVRVHDPSTGQTRDLTVTWPDDPMIIWTNSGWADDQTLVVEGSEESADEETSIRQVRHLLRIHYPEGPTEHWVSPESIYYWYPSPDRSMAFISTPEDTTFVDLAAWSKTPLGAKGELRWHPDGQKAFGVFKFPTGAEWLCRFDVANRQLVRLLEIPSDMILNNLSPEGSYAVLRSKDFKLNPTYIVNVSTGERRRLCLSILAGMTCYPLNRGYWTPDESQYFNLPEILPPVLNFPPMAFDVPPEWRKPPTPASPL